MGEPAIDQEVTDFEDEFDKIASERDGVELDAGDDETIVAEKEADPTDTVTAEDPEKTGDEVADEVEDPPAGDDDQFKGWPEDAVKAYKEQQETAKSLQHRIDSDAGRVSAFQRKINGLENDIQAIKATSPAPQPTKSEITAAMGDDEKWSKFSEDFPEVAEAIDSRLQNAIGATENHINQTLAPVVERQAKTELETAVDVVAGDFPDWQSAVQEDHFQNWLGGQSPGIQALADSDDTNDASSLIAMYDTFRVSDGKDSLRKKDPEPNGGVEVEAKTNDIAAKRQQQLEAGTTVKSKSARIDPDAGAEDSFEAAFNAYAKRLDSQRR